MIKSKHTLGPWTFDEVRTDCGRAFRIGAGEMLKSGKGCCIIYDDYPGNPENERKANARLIAAVPDMYEAVRSLLDLIETIDGGDHDDDPAIKAARAAIAKAEGRS